MGLHAGALSSEIATLDNGPCVRLLFLLDFPRVLFCVMIEGNVKVLVVAKEIDPESFRTILQMLVL